MACLLAVVNRTNVRIETGLVDAELRLVGDVSQRDFGPESKHQYFSKHARRRLRSDLGMYELDEGKPR